MSPRLRLARGLLLVPAALALASCASGGAAAPAQTGVGTSATKTATTPATSAPSTTPAPSETSAPPAAKPARTKAALDKALLQLDDLPPGFSVEPMESGDDNPVISSKRPECKALLGIMNAEHAPGATASAATSFSGGQDGPWIDEYLDALGTPAKVRAFHATITNAVKACPAVTFTLPDGRSTMSVRAVRAPGAGDHSVAFRVTAQGGALDGLEATQVATAIDDVELTMIFFGAYPEEIDEATHAAYEKAKAELGGSSLTS